MIKHKFISSKSDSSDTTLINPSNWNDFHTVDTGCVIMCHSSLGSWTVYKPDGSILDTTGTHSEGLQEAINYAQKYAYPLVVNGGGITSPTIGVPPSTALSTIHCTSTVAFPTGWNNCYHFYNVNFQYNGSAGNDFFTFDSCDLTEVDFHNSQVIYPGTAAVFHFLPVHDNGESFAGFTESTFKLGHIVPVVSNIDLSPDSSKGIGVLITVPFLFFGGLTNGNGVFTSCYIEILEINGGLFGIKLENPTINSGGFTSNTIVANSIHGQGDTSIQIGTSALPNTTQDTSWGNTWKVKVGGVTNLSTWGGADFNSIFQWAGDYFEISASAGTNGIILNSSAVNNLFVFAALSTGIPYTNNATKQTNRVIDTRPLVLENVILTGSPFVYQNKDLKQEMFSVALGTVSVIETSIDNSTWFTLATTTNFTLPLNVGQYIRITYSIAPIITKIY